MKTTKLLKQMSATSLFFILVGCTGHQRIMPHEVITSVANDPKGVEKWVLQNAPSIMSPSHTILALVSKRKEVDKYPVIYQSTVYNYHNDSAKNILFVDAKTNKSSWLFPKNSQLIVEYFSLPHKNHSPFMRDDRESKVIYYKVIDSDTNGDEKVTMQDNKNLAITDTAGKNYKVIVKNISRVISIKEIEKDTMTIIYQKAGVGYSLKLSLNSFEVLSNEVLPKVGE